MKNILILLALCFSSLGFTQGHIPRCNFDSLYLHELESDFFRELLHVEEQQFQDYLAAKPKVSSILTIPVVVHIVKNTSETAMNISDEEIFKQIEILNKTYNNLNSDLTTTPDFFEPLIGNVGIEFCLATVDPEGYSTNGITRITTDVSVFSTVSNNIKYSNTGGADAWDTDFYLNIWVGKISSTILGYSHIPSASIPDQEHGLVVNYPFFGETDHPNYGMGKTAVHEIGHYLNLKHPWGSGNCDPINDWITDTPISEAAYSGMPVHPQTSCETVDMFMNYMDYVYDSSMVMFSIGQANRMRFALENYRPELLESNGCGTPLLIANTELIHTSSENESDGSIHLSIVSGIPPYTINWTSGEESESLTNLAQGDYSVLITDSIGQELSLNFTLSYYGLLYDSDNFETYTSDSLLFQQSSNWFAYCADTFAANISSFSAPEGMQYLEINAIDGLNNIGKDIGGLYSNAYQLSFKMYAPTGRTAAYTIYHDASSCTNPETAFQIQFESTGIGSIYHGGNSSYFDFSQDQWIQISHLIDLDRDIIEFRINDVLLHDWKFSETIYAESGSNKLHKIVFNDSVDLLQQTHYFIDDYKIELVQNSTIGNIELVADTEMTLYPNPSSNFVTIKVDKGATRNCSIELYNTLGQLLDARKWNQVKNSSLQFNIENFTQGVYFFRVQSETNLKVMRFVVSP